MMMMGTASMYETSFNYYTINRNISGDIHLHSHRKISLNKESMLNNVFIFLGGLVVSMLSIIPKVSGFKHGRGRWILRAIKIRITPSYGGEIKP
jgi:hypothetical protein